MRLDIVSALYGLEPGGAEISTRLLINELRAMGVDVEVVSTREEGLNQPGGTVLKGLSKIPTAVILYGASRPIDFLFRSAFIKRWEVRKPDVVLIEEHMSIVGAVEAVHVLRKRGQRIALALTQMWEVDTEFFFKYRPPYMSLPTVYRFRVANAYAAKMDFVNGVTPYIRSRLIDRLRVNPSKCEIMHTVGLPDAPIDEEATSHEPLLIAPGRMNPEKGSLFFLEVVRRIASRRRDFKAVFLGGGPYEASVRNKIARYGLRDVCEVTGKIPYEKFLKLYRAARVVVLPIMYPCGYTRVALEALHAGKPIVAFDHGSMPDIVVNGVTGYRTKPHVVDDFANACELFLNNEELSSSMADSCRTMSRKFGDLRVAAQELKRRFELLCTTDNDK